MGRMGVEPILPITIGTMLNFDRDGHGDGDSVGTCKQALRNGGGGGELVSIVS